MGSRRLCVVSALLVLPLLACDGGDTPQAPLDVETRPRALEGPAPSTEETQQDLIRGWYATSNSSSGTMMLNFDRSDESIWIHYEGSVKNLDVEEAARQHRQIFQSDPAGRYLGSGSVDTTSYGPATWSWGRMNAEDDEEQVVRTDELVLFAKHPTRPVILAFRYTFPATDNGEEKLAELVAVAESVAPRLQGN